MSASNPMLDVGVLPFRDDMDVFSEVIEPVVFTQSFCRFRLSNHKGILDSGAKLQFVVSNKNDMASFLPINTGIHSIIQRAELLIGGKIICSTDDNQYLQTLRKGFHPTDDRVGLDQCYEGDFGGAKIGKATNQTQFQGKVQLDQQQFLPRNLMLNSAQQQSPSFSVYLSDLFPFMRRKQLPLYLIDEPVTIQLTFTQPTRSNSGVCCYNQEVATTGVGNTPAGSPLTFNTFVAGTADKTNGNYSGVAMTGGTGTNATCSYNVSGGAIDSTSLVFDNLTIAAGYTIGDTLTLTSTGTADTTLDVLTISAAGGSISTNSDVSIETEGVKLFCDYLIYPNEKMEELRAEMATNGLSFVYEDTLLVRKNIETQALAGSNNRTNLELGGQGRIVRGVLACNTNAGTNGGGPVKLLGDYSMNAESGTSTTYPQGFAMNWRFNDRRLYNRDVQTSAVKHYHLSQCEDNGGYWCPKSFGSYELGRLGVVGATALQSTNDIVGPAPVPVPAGVLPSDQSSFEGNGATAAQSTNQSVELRGQISPYGVWVAPHHYNVQGSGIQIGSKPIICEFGRIGDATTPANSNSLFRFWIIYERHFVLRDGKCYISY